MLFDQPITNQSLRIFITTKSHKGHCDCEGYIRNTAFKRVSKEKLIERLSMNDRLPLDQRKALPPWIECPGIG